MLFERKTYNNLVVKHKYYNNNFFGRWAWLYDFEKYFLFPLRVKAARFLDAEPKSKIIDVATGTGAQAYELAKLNLNVTGIDLSPEMLEQAKKKCKDRLTLKFQHADATEIPYKDNYFDYSSISLGLHDMPYDIEILVLKEMKRVTKKGGQILIVDYMEPKKHLVAKISHLLVSLYETKNYKPFIKHGLNAILSEVRLKIYRESNFLGLFQIVLVKNNK